MIKLVDLILPSPITAVILHGLLFGLFYLHLLFVLMMLGTAILGIAYFLHAWWGGRLDELRWDKKILRMFMIQKSLAVVLGVGPLLVMQVGFSIPFFTAITLLTPFWILIIVFLILSSLSFDALGHKMYVHPYLHLGLGIAAIISLLAVPGFFVAVLVTTENSDKWLSIVHNNFSFDWRLMVHWFLRYSHILGAGIVFGAAFHYFFIVRNLERKRQLVKWMLGGLLFQIIIGIMLYWSLFQSSTLATYIELFLGIVLTTITIWIITERNVSDVPLNEVVVFPILLALLAAMLLVRQGFQDRALASIVPETQKNVLVYREELSAFHDQAIDRYQTDLSIIYDNGLTIYARSCSFCHGGDGKGRGSDAGILPIPPENITAIRSTRPYIHQILMQGVPGSDMPGFSYYAPDQIEMLMDYLGKQFNIFASPEAIPVRVSENISTQAWDVWKKTCAGCHGMNGGGAKSSRNYLPPPPDFRTYSVSPNHAYEVIVNGYPGTMMSSYKQFPEDVRWGLVRIVISKRSNQVSHSGQ